MIPIFQIRELKVGEINQVCSRQIPRLEKECQGSNPGPVLLTTVIMTWQARESGSGKESHSHSQVCRQCTAQPPSLPPTHTPPSQSLAPKQKGRRELELLLIKDAPNRGGYQSTVFGRYVYFGRRMPRDTIPALRKLSLVYTQRSCPQIVRKCVVCSGIVIHVHIHISVCTVDIIVL